VNNLNQKLMELFQSSDGLLLPDESTLEEISKRQQYLQPINEEIVSQGFKTMRDALQDLANQDESSVSNSIEVIDWSSTQESQGRHRKENSNSLSARGLTRHLSNWMAVLIPPIRTLDIRGDQEIIKCLESSDHNISTLATIMLGHKDLGHLGSIEKFIELINNRRQTGLRLEICCLIYSRYGDPHPLRNEVVPILVGSGIQYESIFGNDSQIKRFLSHIRELVVWDIATNGNGPQTKWAGWWN